MARRTGYLISALVLFIVEVSIALFVRDGFVRGYVGDVLAVALVYAAVRSATQLGKITAVAAALTFALAIEALQAFNLLGALGLADNVLARTILGGSFDLADIAAYSAGAVVVVVMEWMFQASKRGSGP